MKRILLGSLLAGVLSAIGGVAQAAPTAVTCGSVISAPGQYFLMGDCTGAGITITAGDVHLKLMGHTGLPSSEGIRADRVARAHRRAGHDQKLPFRLFFNVVSDSHVEQVSCTANLVGLDLVNSNNMHVNNNVFSANSTAVTVNGTLSSDNHVNNNQATGNNTLGIGVDTGSTSNHINGNTALGNGIDLLDNNPNCDDNKWNGNPSSPATTHRASARASV